MAQGAVTMDGPKSVQALWTVEYFVQVTSDYGSPSGSGWYLDGTEARIKVDPVVEQTPGTRHVFTGWSGDITSPDAEVAVKVDKPLKAQATWKTQHMVKFTTLGLPQGTAMNLTLNGVEKALAAPFTESIWYDAGTAISFNASQRIPVRMGYYLFDHWEDAAGNRPSGQYTVDKPATFSAVYRQGFGCIIATATYGSALSPEVSFLRGFRDHQILSSFAGFSFMAVFNRWYYSFSPHVADQVTLRDWAKPALRVILAPLLAILRISAETYGILAGNREVAAVGAGLIASALIGAVYGSPLAAAVSVVFRRRVRRFKLSARRMAGVTFSFVGVSLVLITAAEIVHSYPLMELATASLVLTMVAFTAHLTIHLVPKAVSIGFNLVKQRL